MRVTSGKQQGRCVEPGYGFENVSGRLSKGEGVLPAILRFGKRYRPFTHIDVFAAQRNDLAVPLTRQDEKLDNRPEGVPRPSGGCPYAFQLDGCQNPLPRNILGRAFQPLGRGMFEISGNAPPEEGAHILEGVPRFARRFDGLHGTGNIVGSDVGEPLAPMEVAVQQALGFMPSPRFQLRRVNLEKFCSGLLEGQAEFFFWLFSQELVRLLPGFGERKEG